MLLRILPKPLAYVHMLPSQSVRQLPRQRTRPTGYLPRHRDISILHIASILRLDNIHHPCYGVYMTRFQVYLGQPQLEILDYFASQFGVPRSRALRSLIDEAGKKVAKKTKKNPLLQMAGFAKNAPANLSQNVDEIYLRD